MSELWLCADADAYARAALHLAGVPGSAPVLAAHPLPPQTAATVVAERDWTARLGLARAGAPPTAREIAAAGRRPRDDRAVVALSDRASLPAAMLAAASSAAFVAAGDDLPDVAELAIVGCADELDDEVLLASLRRTAARLDGTAPWRTLPLEGFVTGRGIAGLSWVVAKLVLAERRRDTRSPAIVWRPTPEGAALTRSGQTVVAAPEAARDVLDRTRFGLLAIETHGFDACANGGAGTVFCGLNHAGPAPEGALGVLACGRGRDCPRGPFPKPLRNVDASVLLVASCNGVRLADSILRSDFNLALSFLDGPGEAYVSAVWSGAGARLAASAFSAVMASGRRLGEAVLAANAALRADDVDHPSYVALGPPWLTIPAGDGRFAELELRDERSVDLARGGRLALELRAGDAATCFARLERDGDGPLVRVFACGLDGDLAEPDVHLSDRAEREREVQDALAGVGRWLDLLGLAAIDAGALRESAAALRPLAAELLLASRGRGDGRERTSGVLSMARRIAEAAAEIAVTELAEPLQDAFWLPNMLAPAYAGCAVEFGRCAVCGLTAVVRRSTHVLNGERRRACVCPRCGICSDTAVGGRLSGLRLEGPQVSDRREPCTATLAGEPGGEPVATWAVARLSADGNRDIAQPDVVRTDSARLGAGVAFEMSAGALVPPHRYFVKALAATADELAFFSRPIFLV